MSQINKRYLDILNEVDKEHKAYGDLHRNSRILIIDGLNTFIRSWSIAPNINDNGEHIGGIVGTLKSIGYAIRNVNPTRVIIVFDGKGGSKSRQSVYSDYKSDRGKNRIRLNRAYAEMMDIDEEQVSMKHQIVALADILTTLPVTVMSFDGVEADDVIGYLSTTMRKDDNKVIIMSADKDFLQLVSENVNIYSPTKKKVYNVNEVVEEYGIHPHNFIYFRMMDGDSSDNIPGIKGMGLKTIRKNFPILTEETKVTLDSLIEYTNSVEKNKFHELFQNNLEICKRNYKLMNLSEPDFNKLIKSKIRNRYDEEIPKFSKQDFLKVGLKYGILDQWKNVPDWLQSSFGYVSQF